MTIIIEKNGVTHEVSEVELDAMLGVGPGPALTKAQQRYANRDELAKYQADLTLKIRGLQKQAETLQRRADIIQLFYKMPPAARAEFADFLADCFDQQLNGPIDD